jgi:DnaK suppressor protein
LSAIAADDAVGLEEKMQDRTRILRRELDQLRRQIAALELALEDKPDYGLGGGAPAVTRWELDRAMLQRLKERAASIERALSQADEATYGICEQCGRPIHADRLAVLPDTRLCVRCARAGEHGEAALRRSVQAMSECQ